MSLPTPTSTTTTTVALKEWAVTVGALGAGTQIFVLRKGGIHEETRHFEIQSNQFFLFPAYEHQKKELLKPEYHKDLESVLASYNAEDPQISIRYFVRLFEDVEIKNEEKVYSLDSEHICTNQFAFERFKWKMKQPLHLLFLRVYKLEHPFVISMKEEYLGCKSWFQLPYRVDESMLTPVLEETDFLQKVKSIKARLRY